MKRKLYLIVCILIISVSMLLFAACQFDVDAKEFTVTVVGGVGGGVFKENASCTVTAEVAQDRVFVEWQIDGVRVSTDVEYSFTVTADVTLTAVTKAKDIDIDPEPSFNLGAFDRKWIGISGGILDLTKGSWSIFDSFKVTSVSGVGGDMRVNCTANGEIDYILILTEDGWLKAIDAEYPDNEELSYVFMPSADSFNGLWALDGEEDVNIMIVSQPNEKGLFGWTIVDGNGVIDEDYLVTATTRLTFDDNGGFSLQFVVSEFDLTYELDGNNDLILVDEALTYKPTAKFYLNSYVDDDGIVYELNVEGGKITVNGSESDCVLKCGRFGAGLYFTCKDTDFALIQALDGVGLYSDKAVSAVRPFVFAGSYFNGSTTLTVNNNLTITIGSVEYSDCFITTLSDLDRVDATAPSGLGGLQHMAIAFDNASKYLIWVNDGVAIITKLGDSYEIQSAYFTTAALKGMQTKFLGGLSSAADIYTTGGKKRITVGLNFEDNKVIINDAAFEFAWHYVIRPTGDEYPVLKFNATVFDEEYVCLLYPYFDYNYVRLEMRSAKESQLAVTRNLSSLYQYEQILGTEYVYAQDGYVNVIAFDTDGTLIVVNGKQNLVERHIEYELTRDYGSDTLIVTFAEIRPPVKFEVSIYCDHIGVSVSMINDVYVNSALSDIIGVYVDGSGRECLEIMSNIKYKLDENGIDNVKYGLSFDSISIEGDTVICKYAHGTISFASGKATVVESSGKTTVYTLKVSQAIIPEEFFGEYVNEGGVVCLQLRADGVFKYDSDGINADTEADKFDEINISGNKVICTIVRKVGLVNSTTVFAFCNGEVTVTVDDNEPIVYSLRNSEIPSEFVGAYADADGVVCFRLFDDGLFVYNEFGIEDYSDVEAFDRVIVDGAQVICTKTYEAFGIKYEITFIFEGDTVTIADDDNDPVVYYRQ